MMKDLRKALVALWLACFVIQAGPVAAQDVIARGTATAAQQQAAQAKAIDKRTGVVTFYDTAGVVNLADRTQEIQDTIWTAYRAYLTNRANSTAFDDQFQGVPGVTAVVPSRACISSPIVVFDKVTLETPAGLTWCGATASASGNATATIWDGSNNKALANSYFPILQVAPGGQLGSVSIYAHDATTRTGGAALGKNWTTSGFTVAAQGSGYTNGDVLTLPQWSRSPYVAATCTVTTDGAGHVASCAQTRQGIYAMPPAMQKRYLTAANGFTGSIANSGLGQVFDPAIPGAYVTSGGSGTGARLYASWTPDFAGDGTNFKLGAYTQMNMHVNYLDMNLGFTNPVITDVSSGTFGKKYGVSCTGLQININKVLTQGGYYGGLYSCTDLHVNSAQHNGAKVSVGVIGSGSFDINGIFDTWEVHALEVDNSQGGRIRARVFHNGTYPAPTATDPAIMLGSNTNSTVNSNSQVDLDLTLAGGFATLSTPALQCAYTRDTRINMVVTNTTKDGTVVTNPTTSWGRFAATCDTSNVFTGAIDKASVQTVALTPENNNLPQANFSIYDGVRGTTETGPGTSPINVLLAPKALTASAWSAVGTPTLSDNASNKAAPDGTNTSTLLTFGTANDTVRQSLRGQAGATTPVCISAWVASGTNFPTIQFGLGDNSATNRALVAFATTTGRPVTNPVTTVGGGVVQSYGAVQYPNSWVRLWVLAQGGATFNNFQINAFPGTTAGSSLNVWGASAVANPRRCPSEDPAALRPFPLTNISVGTTATNIAFAERPGQLWTVSGTNGSASFSDVISTSPGRAPAVVLSDPGVGTPAARTYTVTSGAIQLAMGSGTYAVTAQPATPQ